jgi:cytochrome c553
MSIGLKAGYFTVSAASIPTIMRCCRLWVLCWPLLAVAAEPAPDTLAQRLRACTACHDGAHREGRDGFYPSLDGKPAEYLRQQLEHFQTGRRQQATMQRLLAPLSEIYLAEIAGFFAARRAPAVVRPAAPLDAAVAARGEQLAREGDPGAGLTACSHCHGQALTGALPTVPGLLGLPRNYLVAQLGAWRQGRRHARAPDCMAEVARRLSPDDLGAVAQWLAAQPAPLDRRPAEREPDLVQSSCGRPNSIQL